MGNVQDVDVNQVGRQILKTIRAEVARDEARKVAPEITYDDHCDWHDSGTGDCEND